LRVSPEALALGEMLRTLPAGPSSASNPWAALHELYRFLTFIGGPGPDGLYNWEEAAPDEGPLADGTTTTDVAKLFRPVLRNVGDGGGWGDPPLPPPPPGAF